jgi:hypothetical protein
VMSAQGTYQFIDRNWITAGGPSGVVQASAPPVFF